MYRSYGLNEAKIELQKQIGLNLAKGGKRSSEEEFLFSENLFSVKQEQNIERYNYALR